MKTSSGRTHLAATLLVLGMVTTRTGYAGAPCSPDWHGMDGGVTSGGVPSVNVVQPYSASDSGGAVHEVVLAGGGFLQIGNVDAARIAQWDGFTWSPFGGGIHGPGNPYVADMLVLGGEAEAPEAPASLVVCGRFQAAGEVSCANIARWDGTTWHAFGSGMDAEINSIAEFDPDGEGPEPSMLYAAGHFLHAGGVPATRIARWNGTGWGPVAAGFNAGVDELYAYDGSDPMLGGRALIAAGSFTASGAVPLSRIARFDGSEWFPLGEGATDPNSSIRGLAVYDSDGAGPAPAFLYVVGYFYSMGGVPVTTSARWDGKVWEAAGNISFGLPIVLTVIDPDGEGPQQQRLYMGGSMSTVSGVSVNGIASFDGTTWTGLGSGVLLSDAAAVGSICHFERPSGGRSIVLGGTFVRAGGVDTRGVAEWRKVAPPGDLDGNFAVDSTDLNILLSDFGCTQPPCVGDVAGLPVTDSLDLGILLSYFGFACLE